MWTLAIMRCNFALFDKHYQITSVITLQTLNRKNEKNCNLFDYGHINFLM